MNSVFSNLIISTVLSTFVVAGLVSFKNKRSKHRNEEANENFWARENAANHARRKDISGLDYIEVPFDSMPFVDTDDYDILSSERELKALAGKKIVNLSAYSNTDLKLEYGVANFQTLSAYDENYSQLIRVLANLGCHLSKAGYHNEAVYFLELGISYGSDLSRAYLTLADEYILAGESDKLIALTERAKTLDGVMAPSIVNNLSEKAKKIN